MEKKQIKINGKIAVEIKINGGLFWKAVGPEPVFHYDYAIINTLSNKEDDIALQYCRENGKWYTLNNLNELEVYGVYEEVNDIASATHYEGKLINVNGDEYQYVGGKWQLVGKIENSLNLIYTFGPGSEWDRETPFPMHFQMPKDQLDAKGWFNPYIMSMGAEIELRYDGIMGNFRVMDFSTGSEYRGEITNDDTWVYFNNDCPNEIMVDMIDYWDSQTVDMYAGVFHADVEYGTIDIDTKEGLYGADCSIMTEPYVKNKIYNVDGYFMTHADGGCSRVEGVNPYEGKTSYFKGDETLTEFKLFEPNVSLLNGYFLDSCQNLSSVNLPFVVSMEYYTLGDCSNLKTVIAPNLKNVFSYPFMNTPRPLLNVDFTNCEAIMSMGVYAEYWKGGTVIDLPKCSMIYYSGIYNTANYTELHAPKCRIIYPSAIYPQMNNLSSLTLSYDVVLMQSDAFPSSLITSLGGANFAWVYSSNVSNLTYLGYGLKVSAFYNNSVIKTASLYNAWYMGENTFYKCSNLSNIYAPKVTFYSNGIASCSNLVSVNLEKLETWRGNTFSSFYLNGQYYYYSKLSYVNVNNLKLIPAHFCNCCSSLTSIIMGNASTIEQYAFVSDKALVSISIPNVTTIFPNAFSGCTSLRYVDSPQLREIQTSAFSGCSSLYSINLDNVVTIGDSAFNGCSVLSTFNLPNCESIGYSGINTGMNGKWFVTSISLPKVKYIGDYGIYRLSSNYIGKFEFPECEYIGYNALYHLTESYSVDLHLPKCKYIGDYACNNTKVSNLYLNEVSEVTNLQSSTAFMNKVYKTISIYVPSSLVDGFKVDSVWSWFSDNIYPYEG